MALNNTRGQAQNINDGLRIQNIHEKLNKLIRGNGLPDIGKDEKTKKSNNDE